MAPNYCSSCGTELESGAGFCTNCGTAVEDSGSGDEAGTGGATVPSGDVEAGEPAVAADDSSMFTATAALVGGYFLFVIVGLGASIPALAGVGVLCLVASLVTMYLDLRDLDGKLWDTSPILWVIAAVLLYIVVAPLYLYKRRQIE
jgi:hypothetical protein